MRIEKSVKNINIASKKVKESEKQNIKAKEEKSVEKNSSEALNSYGRAFVNLSFKGSSYWGKEK